MTFVSKTVEKLTPAQFADTVRTSTLRVVEAAKFTAEKTQLESRIALSRGVLKGAQHANDLSKALFLLSQKIAPSAKAKAAPKARAAKKPVAKAAAKPRARKAVAA